MHAYDLFGCRGDRIDPVTEQTAAHEFVGDGAHRMIRMVDPGKGAARERRVVVRDAAEAVDDLLDLVVVLRPGGKRAVQAWVNASRALGLGWRPDTRGPY